MKRVFPAVILLIVLTTGSLSAGVLGFGVKGGMNIANIHGDDSGDEGDWKNGFAGGVFLDWGITPAFGIQPELLYIQNGSETSFLESIWSLKFDYLQVPVLARIDLPVGGPLIPVLYAGPYVSVLVDSKLSVEIDDDSVDLDLKDYTKSFDTGFVFGAALDFGLGPGRMTIEGRYNLGLTEIDDGIGAGLFGIEDIEKTDMKNESWTVMVGFAF